MEEKNKASVVIKYVVLTIFAITAIMPMVYMISSSFMGVNEVRDAIENYKFHIIPDCFTLVQYYDILLKKPDFFNQVLEFRNISCTNSCWTDSGIYFGSICFCKNGISF